MRATHRYVTKHVVIDDAAIDAATNAAALVEPIWFTSGIYDGPEQYKESTAGFSQQQQYLYAVILYRHEVDNGGHDQFFFNSSGVVWPTARAGLHELGLNEAVAILDEAVARLGCSTCLDTQSRRRQLDLVEPDFEDLDTRFYQLQKVVNFDDLLYHYVLQNRSAFYFEGDIQVLELTK